MNTFTQKLIGCNVIIAALFFLIACQESDEGSLKQKQSSEKPESLKPINSIEEKTDLNTNQKTLADEVSEGNIQPLADVFLSITADNPIKKKSFSCDDQVFTVIKFANHQPKLHQINISWKDPNGTERENNSFPFFVTEKETFAWASLKLHRSVGAGMLQWINPAAGMEEFIGNWSVEVQVGDIVNETVSFEVLC